MLTLPSPSHVENHHQLNKHLESKPKWLVSFSDCPCPSIYCLYLNLKVDAAAFPFSHRSVLKLPVISVWIPLIWAFSLLLSNVPLYQSSPEWFHYSKGTILLFELIPMSWTSVIKLKHSENMPNWGKWCRIIINCNVIVTTPKVQRMFVNYFACLYFDISCSTTRKFPLVI